MSIKSPAFWAKKILYGLLIEKKWEVCFLEIGASNNLSILDIFDFIEENFDRAKYLPLDQKYAFYADPFFVENEIFVEGLCAKTGLGKLLHLKLNSAGNVDVIDIGFSKGKHIAYPYTLSVDKDVYIYPDSGSHDAAFVLVWSITERRVKEVVLMRQFPSGLTDPSVVFLDGMYYLFANCSFEPCVLRLWMSPSPTFESAKEHPSSPICVSSLGGRMGGRVCITSDGLYRIGQDLSGSYGNGLILFRVDKISQDTYKETALANLRFRNVKGPHTIDISAGKVLFDFYREELSAMAAYRRLFPRFSAFIGSFSEKIEKIFKIKQNLLMKNTI